MDLISTDVINIVYITSLACVSMCVCTCTYTWHVCVCLLCLYSHIWSYDGIMWFLLLSIITLCTLGIILCMVVCIHVYCVCIILASVVCYNNYFICIVLFKIYTICVCVLVCVFVLQPIIFLFNFVI